MDLVGKMIVLYNMALNVRSPMMAAFASFLTANNIVNMCIYLAQNYRNGGKKVNNGYITSLEK